MSKDRSILLVVEGERTEPRLMKRVLDVYGIKDVEGVYSYGANAYDLWRRMFEGADDFEDLSLTLTLREREVDPERRRLLDKDFSDIILIFDFDPQDHLFSPEKLSVMIEYFDESTMNGKLYINYPMIESYKDLIAVPYDDTFISRCVGLDTLEAKRYKDLVGARSKIPQIELCLVTTLNQILLQNIEKAGTLIGRPLEGSSLRDLYEMLTQGSILRAETELVVEKAVVSVLCTCLWFAIDYRPRKMLRYLRTFSQ